MELTEAIVWQQAAGDNDRNYAELCIRWGVILNGPGHLGQWPECGSILRENGFTAKKVTDLKRFCEDMEDGHLVVLRVGTASVIAVGLIVGPYEWHDGYGDIDGWNLQHVRRVRWLWSNLDSPAVFDTYSLKLGDTTQRLNDGPVREWLSSLAIPDEASRLPLPLLPKSLQQGDLPVSEISEFLFEHGVASASITNLVNEIGELSRIAKWYQRAGMPSEHETVAYLVVPLLRALGWTPSTDGR